MKKVRLLILFITLGGVNAFAQDFSIWQQSYLSRTAYLFFLQKKYNPLSLELDLKSVSFVSKQHKNNSCVIPDFKPEDLPIFCRIEHHLDKKGSMNVRFRLGTQDIVDQLEGKR